MKKYITTLAIAVIVFSANAQDITKNIEFKSGRASGNVAESKLKKAPKKVFINEFRCFYQLVYVDQEQTKAGVNYGTTKASLKVGLNNISSDSLQAKTDELYSQYVNQLKEGGISVVSAEKAKGIKQFQDFKKVKGGTISSTQLHGYAMVTPTDFEYFIKKVDKKGKQKSGLMDKRGKISSQLDDIVVVNINLYVSFMSESESRGSKLLTSAIGGVSKVVASPNFRVKESNSKASYLQSNKSSIVALNLPMKKDIEINGVFDDKKYKSVSSATQNTETDYGAMTVVFTEHVDATNLQTIDVDQSKYYNGIYNGCSYYLNESTKEFIKYTKGEK